ncbi:MAG: hypothetical protein WD206_07375 [Actinomycetota bacterium]
MDDDVAGGQAAAPVCADVAEREQVAADPRDTDDLVAHQRRSETFGRDLFATV